MTVTTQVLERVLVVRLDRPAKGNAIDAETTAGLDEALNRLEDDPALWVGVLTGTPTLFCAGTDLARGPGAPTARGGEYGLVRRRRTKPLVAAVEGVAFGGGFELALACDLVVASATARFALPETRRGVVATSGALFRVVRALPLHLAKELLIAGTELSGERAHALGVVNRLTAPGEALAGALALAEDVCASSPAAVQATLAAVAAQLDEQDARGWEATATAIERITASADLQEGVAAFLERRTPQWQGL